MDLGYFEIDEEVQKNTLEAVEVFRSLGCQVDEVDVGWNFGALDAWYTLCEGAFWGLARDLYPRWKFEMDGFVGGPLTFTFTPGQSGAYMAPPGDGSISPDILAYRTTYTFAGDGDLAMGLGPFSGEIFLPYFFISASTLLRAR